MNPRERIGFAELPASRRVGSPLLAAGLALAGIQWCLKFIITNSYHYSSASNYGTLAINKGYKDGKSYNDFRE